MTRSQHESHLKHSAFDKAMYGRCILSINDKINLKIGLKIGMNGVLPFYSLNRI